MTYMIKSDNSNRIKIFGDTNRLMNNEVPHNYIDIRVSRMQNYLDQRIIKRWVLPRLSSRNKTSIRILDVGAGTGRMVKYLSSIGNAVVSIEPYQPFFAKLKDACVEENISFYQCTLQEYFKIDNEPFDFIYVSGVLMYHIDIEALDFMSILNKLIKPDGYIIIRDWGLEKNESSDSLYSSLIREGIAEVMRTPVGVKRLALNSGLQCIKWGRPYPINIPSKMYRKWPNKVTDAMLSFFTFRFFYPLWVFLSLFHAPKLLRKCYFVYLLQRKI
jgi:SAM-dependent methyltransferase